MQACCSCNLNALICTDAHWVWAPACTHDLGPGYTCQVHQVHSALELPGVTPDSSVSLKHVHIIAQAQAAACPCLHLQPVLVICMCTEAAACIISQAPCHHKRWKIEDYSLGAGFDSSDPRETPNLRYCIQGNQLQSIAHHLGSDMKRP